ncbi:MAG: EscU/YscU/HrcU family type III secretion system export apparatus switch protein [Pirellulales bacterium]
MDDATADKMFPPTPRRREQARREGRAPRSASLVGAAAALGLFAALRYGGATFMRQLETTGARAWEGGAWVSLSEADPVGELQLTVVRGLALVAPWLGILMASAAALHWLQAGWMLRPERLVEGAARLGSGLGDPTEQGGRAAWGLAQMIAVVAVAVWRSSSRLTHWTRLAGMPLESAMRSAAAEVLDLGLYVAGVLAVLGIVDYGWRWWRHERSLWMTLEELKQEMKEDAGGRRPAPPPPAAVTPPTP